MKICYMGNIDAVHTRRWAEAFAQMGHDVHVIYMGGEDHNISNLEKAGITVHLLNSRSSNSSPAVHKESRETSWKLHNRIKNFYMRLPKRLTIPL